MHGATTSNTYTPFALQVVHLLGLDRKKNRNKALIERNKRKMVENDGEMVHCANGKR